MWCIAKVDGEYIARMEVVWDLYLIGEVREPTAAAPGQACRYDAEYERNGTANLFVMLDAHQPWKHVKVTERTGEDFAKCKRDLGDRHHLQAEKVRVHAQSTHPKAHFCSRTLE